ncbi:MAG: cysteine desulfurase [Clostridia bacterium]|nr:cysteine desulfurase [Clostridia bacterium]
MKKRVYCDFAATTYVSSEVLNEMLPCFNTVFGNSSSLHGFGRDAVALVDKARDRVQKAIGAEKPSEVYFTSGGTEANNWAIKGLARANKAKGKHIITSAIEHDSVLEACKQLEEEGFEVTYLPVDSKGLVSITDLIHNLRPTTCLVSVMAVNNEIGTIQNIKTIANLAHEYGAIFHTDAVQALGAIKLNVKDMEIDAMSISSHKIYGPKGVGALYVKQGIKIAPIIAGGSQERGLRGGTNNVPGIVGFGKAIEIANRDLAINQKKLKSIRLYFLTQVMDKIPHVTVNGHPYQKVQGTINLSFEMIESEALLMLLDMEGIAVSTGSACTSGSPLPSHVLKAIGLTNEFAKGSLRFSFGKSTTKADVDYIIEKLVASVAKLREMSPVSKAGRKKKKA